MTFAAANLAPTIGTEIGIDKASLISGVQAPALRRLLEQRGVLVFREIQLTDAEQVKVAASLGSVRGEGKNGIFKVTLDAKENPRAEYLIGAFNWHMDGTHEDVPCLSMTGAPAPMGFCNLRVHDLKHTFGRRLRAAGVSFEDRQDLLGHKSQRITTYYSAAEVACLIAAVERIVERRAESPTTALLRRDIADPLPLLQTRMPLALK